MCGALHSCRLLFFVLVRRGGLGFAPRPFEHFVPDVVHVIAQHLWCILERRAVFALTAIWLLALDSDQRLAIDSIAGLALTQLDTQFMGVDAAATKAWLATVSSAKPLLSRSLTPLTSV